MYEQAVETPNVEIIKMVQRALDVMDVLRSRNEVLTPGEIGKRCGFPAATAARILSTLELDGWVTRYSEDRYGIGEKVSFVIEKDNLFLALMEAAGPIMDKCTSLHNQAMNLIVREGQKCYILQQSRTNKLVDYVPPLHAEMPFYACAGGKVILSGLPRLTVEHLLDACDWKPLTPHTITDKETFLKELASVARQGYAFDHQEGSENGSCIAVPVYDNQGNVIAGLSFSGIMGIEDPQVLVSHLPALRETAEAITHALYKF